MSRAAKRVEVGQGPTTPGEVAQRIIDQITAGEYRSGGRLPSQSEMTESYGASARAVGRAIRILRSSGYVEMRPNRFGGGVTACYVTPPDRWRTTETGPSGSPPQGAPSDT